MHTDVTHTWNMVMNAVVTVTCRHFHAGNDSIHPTTPLAEHCSLMSCYLIIPWSITVSLSDFTLRYMHFIFVSCNEEKNIYYQ